MIIQVDCRNDRGRMSSCLTVNTLSLVFGNIRRVFLSEGTNSQVISFEFRDKLQVYIDLVDLSPSQENVFSPYCKPSVFTFIAAFDTDTSTIYVYLLLLDSMLRRGFWKTE